MDLPAGTLSQRRCFAERWEWYRARGQLCTHHPTWMLTVLPACAQVLPKLSSSIVHEIDSILGNKPYSKKDYRS